MGGAATPVPMMKTLLEKIINYEAIPPDNDGKSGIAKVDTAQNYTVKDYTKSNLKSTIETLIDEGIDFEVIGSGDTIAKQSPAGGTQLKAKPSKLLLSLSNSGKTTLVPVPDVTGLSASDAKRMLESSGFKCSVADDSNLIQMKRKLMLLKQLLMTHLKMLKLLQKKSQIQTQVSLTRQRPLHLQVIRFMYRCHRQM